MDDSIQPLVQCLGVCSAPLPLHRRTSSSFVRAGNALTTTNLPFQTRSRQVLSLAVLTEAYMQYSSVITHAALSTFLISNLSVLKVGNKVSKK